MDSNMQHPATHYRPATHYSNSMVRNYSCITVASERTYIALAHHSGTSHLVEGEPDGCLVSGLCVQSVAVVPYKCLCVSFINTGGSLIRFIGLGNCLHSEG